MRGEFIRQAFEQTIEDAIPTEEWYVTLMETEQEWGGPEEGGWWRTIHTIISYKQFPNEELARRAAEKVKKLAEELKEEAQKVYGKQCLREMAWLDARGLDADFLPEPDGPTDYYVHVGQSLPDEGCSGPSHYE